MILTPSFRPGPAGTPEILEPDLPEPMSWDQYIAWLNPTPKVTRKQLQEWELAHPVKTAKDNYGWRTGLRTQAQFEMK